MNSLRFYKKKCEDIKENSKNIALEISLRATARGFESHRLRRKNKTTLWGGFILYGMVFKTVGFERPTLHRQGNGHAGGMFVRPWENPCRPCRSAGYTLSAIFSQDVMFCEVFSMLDSLSESHYNILEHTF